MGRLPRHLGELPVVRAGLLAVALASSASPARAEWVSDGRYVMGTVLEVTLDGDRSHLERVYARVGELESIFSSYDSESAVSRLNGHAGRGAVPVPEALERILLDAQRYTSMSGGTFDVTVGPLVSLWTQAARRNVAPTAEELAATLEKVGAAKLRVGEGTAELPLAGMRINLGGVAKGWALDRIEEELRGAGVERALVSFGQSSTLALGTPDEAEGWRLLLRGPGNRYAGLVTLRDGRLSVSGSFGRASVIAGRRYGHVIDPRSGAALERSLQAAVVAPSGGLAEALSKALLLLGPDEGLALLERHPGVEGLLVDGQGTQFETSGWAETVGYERAPTHP